MRAYSIISPIWKSFYSRGLYRDVAKNWRAAAFVYLLLLLILAWIPHIFKWHNFFGNFVKTESTALVAQIPTLTIKEGHLSVDKPTPYFIKDPDTGKVIATIDTSGEYNDIKDLQSAEGVLLLTGDNIIYKVDDEEYRVRSLKGTPNMTVGAKDIEGWLQKGQFWILLLFYPIIVFLSFLYRVVQSLIYGLAGLVFTFFTNTQLTYMACVSLAMVALTPAIIIGTVIDYFNINLPYDYWIYFLISMFYLYYGVDSNASSASSTPMK